MRHHHDLATIACDERERFPALDDFYITWGMDRAGTRLRSIRFGTWDPRRRVVRIHPRLDDPRVPDWLVRFVVYHELCHAHLKSHLHSIEFKRLEAEHPDFANARTWERAHIKSILSATWSTPRS